jgi:hypothetical protein
MSIRSILLAVVVTLLISSRTFAAITVSGHVNGVPANAPVSGVSVTVKYAFHDIQVASVTTDGNGYYQFTVPGPEEYDISFSKTEYYSTSRYYEHIDANTTIDVNMTHKSDPPTEAVFDAEGSDLAIYYDDSSGKHKMYMMEKGMVYIVHDSDAFDSYCASILIDDFEHLTHGHSRFEYGSSMFADATVAAGKSFWDWIYSGVSTSGTDPSFVTNCVGYAFNGRAYGTISICSWVDPSGPSMDMLLQPFQVIVDNDSLVGASINDGDIAGDSGRTHYWVLHDPVIGEGGNGPAQTIQWKNNCSGVYTWDVSTNPDNPAPAAEIAWQTYAYSRYSESTTKTNPLLNVGYIWRDGQ